MLERLRTRMALMLAPAQMHDEVAKGENGPSFFGPVGQGLFGAGHHPERSAGELLDAYSRNPWLRAVTAKIGKSVGTTCWRLLRPRIADGAPALPPNLAYGDWPTRQRRYAEVDRVARAAGTQGGAEGQSLETVERHPLLDLLNHGNPNFPGQVALQVTQEHLDIVGEAFWLKERDRDGGLLHLWPVPPTWVRALPNRDHPYYRIDFQGTEQQVPPGDVIAFKEPDPANPYGRGTGIAKALGDELETDEFAARHMRQTFQNRARPDFIVTPPDGMKLQPEQVERLRQSWIEKTRGVLRAGVPLFLPQSMKFTPISQTFENLQLTELRRQGRDFTLQVYGMPPEKMGINATSNRATIEGADLIFAKEVLMPRQDHIRAVLQNELVPEFDENLILDFESPVLDDRRHRLAVTRGAPWAFTANEYRAQAGEPTLGEAGDFHFVPRTGEFKARLAAAATTDPDGAGAGHSSDQQEGN